MKAERIEFDTNIGVKWLTVIYELFDNGHKHLSHIYYDDLPLDIAELFTSNKPADKELYNHVMAAMDNNAESVMEERKEVKSITGGLFETLSKITRDHNKIFYGV